ncbi:MAG: tandem-95 repeat protein, partial [Chloroflexi bacterium]
GTFSYSHDGSETASDSFTYKACDNGTTNGSPDGKCSGTATVSLTVTPVNDAPVSVGDSATTNEDTSVDVNVLANDTDVDNANSDLRTVSLRNVTGGTAIVLLDGRTVRFSPNSDANSSDGWTFKFTYKANDGALDSASAAIVTITVNPVNDIPRFTKGADQTVNEDSGAHTALGWATNLSTGPANEGGQTLAFIVGNDNNGLFSSQPAISSTGTLTYTPATQASGVATITVQIHDNGGTANGGVDTSAPQTFMITVNPVNDIPSFTKGADQTVNEDASTQTVSGWATNLGKGPANESGQTLDFIVSNNNNGLFSGQPAVSSTGTLTFTSAPNANGVATVTVKIHDDGGTANGGVDTSAPQTVTITVNPVNDGPVLTMSASSTGGQYSDQPSPVITLTATDIDNMGSQLTFSVDAPGLPASLVLTPAAGSTAPASPSSPGTRTATISGPLGVAPGTYLRTIRVSDGAATDTKPLTVNVTQENADPVVYTGPSMQFTASTTTTSATVQLQATITDINDGSRGDIRNAIVHFMNMDTVPATELCQVAYPASAPKTFALINPADLTQATAGCPYTFSLGSADSNSWDIGIFVDGYYTRAAQIDDSMVTVSKPLASQFITGGGYLRLTSATAGINSGDVGSKNNFGFNVKYNSKGTNLQGRINTIIRRNGHLYQVKGNNLQTLGVLYCNAGTGCTATPQNGCTYNASSICWIKATFKGGANIQDVTNPANPISLDGGATLQMDMTDYGEPGSNGPAGPDSMAITVINKAGNLWYSSNWNGTKTVEQLLDGGNLVVH